MGYFYLSYLQSHNINYELEKGAVHSFIHLLSARAELISDDDMPWLLNWNMMGNHNCHYNLRFYSRSQNNVVRKGRENRICLWLLRSWWAAESHHRWRIAGPLVAAVPTLTLLPFYFPSLSSFSFNAYWCKQWHRSRYWRHCRHGSSLSNSGSPSQAAASAVSSHKSCIIFLLHISLYPIWTHQPTDGLVWWWDDCLFYAVFV